MQHEYVCVAPIKATVLLLHQSFDRRQVLWSIAFEDDCYGSCIPLVAACLRWAPCFSSPHRLFVQPLHRRLSSQSNC